MIGHQAEEVETDVITLQALSEREEVPFAVAVGLK